MRRLAYVASISAWTCLATAWSIRTLALRAGRLLCAQNTLRVSDRHRHTCWIFARAFFSFSATFSVVHFHGDGGWCWLNLSTQHPFQLSLSVIWTSGTFSVCCLAELQPDPSRSAWYLAKVLSEPGLAADEACRNESSGRVQVPTGTQRWVQHRGIQQAPTAVQSRCTGWALGVGNNLGP